MRPLRKRHAAKPRSCRRCRIALLLLSSSVAIATLSIPALISLPSPLNSANSRMNSARALLPWTSWWIQANRQVVHHRSLYSQNATIQKSQQVQPREVSILEECSCPEPLPELQGYLQWPKPWDQEPEPRPNRTGTDTGASRTGTDPGSNWISSVMKKSCEEMWGNGFRLRPLRLLGDPPEGAYMDADEAAASACTPGGPRSSCLGATVGGGGGVHQRQLQVEHPRTKHKVARMLLGENGNRLSAAGGKSASETAEPLSFGGRVELADASRGEDRPGSSSFGWSSTQSPNTKATIPVGHSEGSAGVPRAGHFKGSNGWLRCFSNPLSLSSLCEGAMVAVYPGRIRMADGGEDLADAPRMRNEAEEIPDFTPGAIEVPEGAAGVPGGATGVPGTAAGSTRRLGRGAAGVLKNASKVTELRQKLFGGSQASLEKYSRTVDVFGSIRGVPSVDCSMVVNTPTLFIVRWDYVNLYFSMMTWYNAFQAVRLLGLKHRPSIVIMDGHAKGNLDPVFSRLFSGFRFIKSFPVGAGAVCFKHAIFVSPGHSSPIYRSKGRSSSSCSFWIRRRPAGAEAAPPVVRLTEFAEFVAESFNFKNSSTHWAPRLRNRGSTPSRGPRLHPPLPVEVSKPRDQALPRSSTGTPNATMSASSQAQGSTSIGAAYASLSARQLAENMSTQRKGASLETAPGTSYSSGGRSSSEGGKGLLFSPTSTNATLILHGERQAEQPSERSNLNSELNQHAACELGRSNETSAGQGALPRVPYAVPGGAPEVTMRPLRVLFVRRDAAYVHPRQKLPLKTNTRLRDQEGLVKALVAWARSDPAGDPGVHQNRSLCGGYPEQASSPVAGRALLSVSAQGRRGKVWGRRRAGSATWQRQGARSNPSRSMLQHFGVASSRSGRRYESQSSSSRLQQQQAIAAAHLAQRQRHQQDESGASVPVHVCPRAIEVLNATMAAWSFEWQLQAVLWADVMVGPHGAGLSHAVFMRPGTALIELRDRRNGVASMATLAGMRGLQYRRVYAVDLQQQVRFVQNLLLGLTCLEDT